MDVALQIFKTTPIFTKKYNMQEFIYVIHIFIYCSESDTYNKYEIIAYVEPLVNFYLSEII